MLKDPSNCFVISSDFCHWGQRFRYTQYDQEAGDIYQWIEALDKQVLPMALCQSDSMCTHFK